MIGLTGIAALEAEMRDRLTAKNTEIESLRAQLALARKALEEIAEGRGRYSQDRFEHACNTIEYMKAIANAALKSQS